MGRTDTTDLGGRWKRHTGRTCHRKHTSRSGSSWSCRCQQQEGYAHLGSSGSPLPFSSRLLGFGPAAMEEVSPPSSSSGGKSVLHGKYEMGRLLGHGSFAKVYYARNIHTGRSVAMKVVGKEKVVKAGMMEQVKREIAVMKMVTCPNIVELYEVMATRSKIYFAMELVRGGELFSKIARGGRLPEDTARRYFRQLISAVDFCHSRGVYHRDLKLENLLLDDGGDLKVADFGLSAFADHRRADGLLHTTCGTPAYVAPEVIGKRGYDGAKADLWSCGVILYVLLAGFLPFQDDNIVSLYKKIHRGDFRCPPWFSSEARRLVTKLLDPDPNTRITAAKLMETPWFKRPVGDTVDLISHVEEDHGGKNTRRKEKEPRSLNAFHIISLSPGLDLSPLFEDGDEYRRAERAEGIRFATAEPARVVISRLEAVAAKAAGRFTVTTEIFTVVSSVLVVEVRKEGGDTAEYRSFCSNELWPALEDIVLGFPNSLQKTTATTATA